MLDSFQTFYKLMVDITELYTLIPVSAILESQKLSAYSLVKFSINPDEIKLAAKTFGIVDAHSLE